MKYFKAPTSVPDPALRKRNGDMKFAQFAHLNEIVDELNKLAPALHARVATTADITLSGTQTIDGIAVVAGDVVLVKNQSTGSQNGLYVVKAGAWVREDGLDEASEFVEGRLFTVADGTVNGDSLFMLDTTGTFVVGTSTATFVPIGGSASVTGEFVALTGDGTYTGTIANFPAAYTTGQKLFATFDTTNLSSPTTVNINGIGAAPLTLDVAGVIETFTIVVGRVYKLVYDGTSFQIDAYANILNSRTYLPLNEVSGSMTDGMVAGTYAFGQGVQVIASGVGSATPIALIVLEPTNYAPLSGVARTLRIWGNLSTNDVAPTGNYTIGLYPVTRPASSGGAGVNIYTLGTLVVGSDITIPTPAADTTMSDVSAPFLIPATGYYVIGVTSTTTVDTNAHVHINARLEIQCL
jgi:hypothetical protein